MLFSYCSTLCSANSDWPERSREIECITRQWLMTMDIENKRQLHRMHRKMITETQNNNSLHNEGIGFKQILVQVWGLGIYRRECRIDQRFCWS